MCRAPLPRGVRVGREEIPTRRGAPARSLRCAGCGTAGSTRASPRSSASSATIPVVPAYAPSITIAPPSGLPRSVATLVAATRMTVTGACDLGGERRVVHEHQPARAGAWARSAPRTRRASRSPTTPSTRPAAPRSGRRRSRRCCRCCRRASCRRRGRGYITLRPSSVAARASTCADELHALAADARDQQLSFHVTSFR